MKHTRILFFIVLATAAAVYARTAQILYLTEPGTGFFDPAGTAGAVALLLFIAFCLVSAAVISSFTRRNPSGAPTHSVAAIIGAAALAIAGFYDAFFVNYVSGASIVILLTRICAVLSSLSLMLYIFRFFIPQLSKVSKMFYLPVLFFFMLKLISTFTVYSTVSVIADNVFHIAFLCCAMIFALFFLKLENGIRPGHSAYRLFPLGAMTVILSACCVIPVIVAFVLGQQARIHTDPNALVFPAGVGVFAACYVLALYKKKNIIRRKRNTPRLESNTSYHEMSGQFVSGTGKHRRKK